MMQKVLIANRGEIAVRIMRTLKDLGIASVAVYSDADRHAMHVDMADEAVHIGANEASDSYLRSDKILAAAKAVGADAIHPGYGFLSENAGFARAVAEAGLIFIGPPADAIDAMGDKASAKALLSGREVPLVPGYHGDEQSDERLLAEALNCGFPLLLKASAGGGGKGMRIVEQESELGAEIAAARREAASAFGDDRLLIERFLRKPRHVEVQVFCDQQGNGVYLFERDCSVQRRHQKVIEEAPAPGMTSELRQRMGEAALAAAHAIGYVGAGTVEFLLDTDGSFYFMEMNTRLQVEHPVTEMITGQDLVHWQLLVASGHALPLTQEQLRCNGHAIEVRLYAEDPDNGFLPALGTLNLWREPRATTQVRIDSGVRQGDQVSPHYDPMLAKLIVHGDTREQALRLMRQALADLLIDGVKTNRDFLLRLLSCPAFVDADLSTDLIDRSDWQASQAPDWHSAALVELLLPTLNSNAHSPWFADGFQPNLAASRQLTLMLADGRETRVSAERIDQAWQMDGQSYCSQLQRVEQDLYQLLPQRQWVLLSDDDMVLFDQHGSQRFVRQRWLGEQHEDDHGGLHAPMSGHVLAVNVAAGDTVKAGDVLMIMEAMKMEHSIRAGHDAVVEQLLCAAGDSVREGDELVVLSDAVQTEEPA